MKKRSGKALIIRKAMPTTNRGALTSPCPKRDPGVEAEVDKAQRQKAAISVVRRSQNHIAKPF
jgi:hypothetical protein